jgi:Protein of unknown function (DUF4087)
MIRITIFHFMFGFAVLIGLASAAHAERRCGWIINPTPANWSLRDAQDEWVISVQGGKQAEGFDSIPDLTEREWITTNAGSYGYGCACLDVKTNVSGSGERSITRIMAVKQRPLRACRADKKLKKPTE